MTLSNQPSQMDLRAYAWNYFSLHAAQRMSIFQFFISLSTAIVGGAVLIAGSADDREWSALLFLILPFLSFIFWRLDRRTSELIKNAEKALISLESDAPQNRASNHDPLSLFTNDKSTTDSARTGVLFGHFSYSRSFRYVFLATGMLGLIGAFAALLSASGNEKRISSSVPMGTIGPCARGTECSLIKLEVGRKTSISEWVELPDETSVQGEQERKDESNGK